MRRRSAVFGIAAIVAFAFLYVLSTGDVTDTVSVSVPQGQDAVEPRARVELSVDVPQSQPQADHAPRGARGAAGVLSAEHAKAGFTQGPIPPVQQREVEADANLRETNKDYHSKRAALREYQAANSLGPLKIHTYYTVDCTYHSLWQVLALEYTWNRVEQGGFISRVISGCGKPTDEKTLAWKKSVLPKQVEETRFGSYFAPTFSVLPSGEYYAPYNRPNAIWYWLNHTDLTEDIFILLDPDMAFLKRLVVADVKRGHPVAQYYSYMSGTPFDKYVCELCPGTAKVASMGGKLLFDVGPPWMMHVDDLRMMVASWVHLVPMLRKIDPTAWIIEMVAYSVAAGYHNLPHELIYHGMVDNVGQEKAWNEDNTITTDMALIHYCFTWEVGELVKEGGGGEQMERMMKREADRSMPVVDYYHWSKYRMPTDWPGGRSMQPHNLLSCNCPIMQEFHTTNALPDVPHLNQHFKRIMVFLRTYLPLLNEVLTIWKLDVLQCEIPDEAKERALQSAMSAFAKGQSRQDPTGTFADAFVKNIVNLSPQLRTAHPAYWISKYVVDSTSSDLKTITFRNASSYRKEMFEKLRRGERPPSIPWPPTL